MGEKNLKWLKWSAKNPNHFDPSTLIGFSQQACLGARLKDAYEAGWADCGKSNLVSRVLREIADDIAAEG